MSADQAREIAERIARRVLHEVFRLFDPAISAVGFGERCRPTRKLYRTDPAVRLPMDSVYDQPIYPTLRANKRIRIRNRELYGTSERGSTEVRFHCGRRRDLCRYAGRLRNSAIERTL